MVRFQEKEYQLFFSNNLEPLRALNYADELFFSEFERFTGARYRILSIIRKGWQEKYGLQEDINGLQKHFEEKLSQDEWSGDILTEYEKKRKILTKTLSEIQSKSYADATNAMLSKVLTRVRSQSAPLDAMSNMLHLFSSLLGGDFILRLKKYSDNKNAVNEHFIFYTQPIKESKYAKFIVKNFSEKFALSKIDRNLSNILKTGAYVKDDVSTLLEERGAKLAGLLKEIARRLSVTPNDLYYLAMEEVKNGLKNGKSVIEIIQKRRALTVLFYPGQKLQILEGEKAEVFLREGGFQEFVSQPVGQLELKGQVASLGKVSGRAVVVKNSDEAIKLVGPGDVLVAPYTAPEYLPAMKKAVAIVTETGGITSHAAIVSRELKIPCVIAVPSATSILHTGDRIEVDANNGIIKVIK